MNLPVDCCLNWEIRANHRERRGERLEILGTWKAQERVVGAIPCDILIFGMEQRRAFEGILRLRMG
jgi:hypothetical protein